MCGLAGCWPTSAAQMANGRLRELAERMAHALVHRGPDDGGAWAAENAGLAFGHRRLAILDLSAAGHQPMSSASGRWVLAFNGEVYNHMALRAELSALGASPAWRGHSDTETLIVAFEQWGVEDTLQRCVGMFAMALWDHQARSLTLARDRMGEKPLYYGWAGGAFLFGSELKALKAYPGFDAPVCRRALAQYLRFMYVPAPRSIYQGIFKLEPGCLLTVQGQPPVNAPEEPLRPGQSHGSVVVQRWWSLDSAVEAGALNPLANETEAVRLLEDQLATTVKLQSLADVPLGAFLSGGVDSSTIVALMQQQSTRPVQTFTIGFDEPGFDEAPHALAVAQHLGTEHHELRVSAQMAQDVVPTLPWMYGEPFADASQIPMHLVSKAARQYVTVALSGDAGDELFGGYNRYFWGPKIWNKVAWLPMPMRRSLGRLITTLPIKAWDVLGERFQMASGPDGVTRLGDKAHKLGVRMQTVRDINDLYRSLVSEWEIPASLVVGLAGAPITEPPNGLDGALPSRDLEKSPLHMMYQDAKTYLPDDILCKVDRAAMACSLETRIPFLDHRVVELAWRLPLNMKIRENASKWILRQVLYKYVPKALIERPKAGFGVPIGQWLRGPLRAWAEDLLAEPRLVAEGYLRSSPIRHVWAEHLSGRRDHTGKLWAVLMFQAWLHEQAKPHLSAG